MHNILYGATCHVHCDQCTEVNAKYKAFIKSVLHPFSIAFPLELRHRKKPQRKRWIIQSIQMVSQKMRLLNTIKNLPELPEETNLHC